MSEEFSKKLDDFLREALKPGFFVPDDLTVLCKESAVEEYVSMSRTGGRDVVLERAKQAFNKCAQAISDIPFYRKLPSTAWRVLREKQKVNASVIKFCRS